MSNATKNLQAGPEFAPTEAPPPKTIRKRPVPSAASRSTAEPREPRLERIARRAHEIYEARGGQHGRDLDDWLRAEREIDAEIERERDGSE
jgi:hypothetical protein